MSHQTNHLYDFGQFRLDAGERQLLRDGESIPLTPKAFDLLLALVERHGHLLEKYELLKKVWPDTLVEEANLSYNISLIRKALGDGENGQKFIETIPKRGYRFVAEVRQMSGEQAESVEVRSSLNDAETLPENPARRVNRYKKASILVLGIAVFAIGGIGFGLYGFITRSKNIGFEPKIIPLTSLPGDESQPAFSPDGNQIAFVWRNEKEADQTFTSS